MKQIFTCILLAVSLSFFNCSKSEKGENEKQASSKMPVFALVDSASYDFGTIQEGAIVEHEFKFKNEGEYPLILNNISSSCGCTTPEWPKEPIGPNQTSSIKVRFDSKNKSGPQVKTITVYANTEPAYSELRLKGIVNAAPKPQESK
ncbi:DUF1573 domain-containing protein [Dyadobacter sp. Leaf189]|jgi:hypothetical protein|uniref:DUF1573 domain-containing protein n=1 Tax=Dyadobacter sp. Leaf189 TaxID=1736295 RepID=UPI0006F51D1A|nr:DUF1573 domain-containing protein [Dyadobacter sp. Leaf189]KQS33570.1 hypothetical protein ASG33_05745 [Dyadobacter sp. Leaf189]